MNFTKKLIKKFDYSKISISLQLKIKFNYLKTAK